jgi:hypothetical protein
MKEKRKHKRFKLQNQPLVCDANSNMFLGNMVDVSVGGFKLRTNEKLTQGKDYLLKIITQSDTDGGSQIIAKINVRWCNENPDSNDYYVGCSLGENDLKTRLELSSLVIQALNG